VPARVLPPMSLAYRNPRNEHEPATITPETTGKFRGGWRVPNQAVYMEPGGTKRVLVGLFPPPNRRLDDFLRQEVLVKQMRDLRQAAQRRGVTLQFHPDLLERGDVRSSVLLLSNAATADQIDEEWTRLAGPPKEGDMLLAINPDANNNAYTAPIRPILKAWASRVGVVLQTVKVGKINKPPPGYYDNLLNKLNLKTGGANYFPTHGHPSNLQPGIGLLCACPTLLLGCDAHHPPPGSSKPSYAAVVGFLEPKCWAQWPEARVMTTRQECFDFESMREMTIAQLEAFKECNGCHAERIIHIRDGVGEAMFEAVHLQEVRAIEAACKARGDNYTPQIVSVVEQKRNGARFFSVDERSGRVHEDQMGCPEPGTVVDEDVVGDRFDFYLTPHHGLKGTSRPTRYHVLRNDAGFNADELEPFMFQLCHMFGRCQKIVSQVAPTYQAHLLAELWGLKEERPDAMSDTASVSSDVACEVHERLKRRPFYV